VAALTRTRILVVEDDGSSACALARLLEQDGFEVDVARDGAAAIVRLSHGALPDLLCTDVQLPHASGVALARYARSLDPCLPVVLTTGYPEHAEELLREMTPPPVVLTKPLDYRALRIAIHALLGIELGAMSVRTV
jgi:CheY-like chemotaxis protein